MSCVTKRNICVIRGDEFEENVALDSTWEEVIANPAAFQGRMTFREEQYDGAQVYLTLTATPEIVVSPDPDDLPILLQFGASAIQTGALPSWNIVYFVELVPVGASGGKRLYEGKVKIGD